MPPSLLFFLSPTNLLLSWTTLTVALPICAVSLTATQILGLEPNDRRGKHTTVELELGAAGGGTTKGALSGGARGKTLERRLSSTNSALIPVPEELEQDDEGEDGDGEEEGGFVTCEEEEEEDEDQEQHDDEEEEEDTTYQFVQSLLKEHENDDFQAQLQLGQAPPSPRLVSSIDPSTLPSLLSEPMPFNFSSSSPDPPLGLEDSPPTTTTTSSPSVGTPGDGDHSPTVETKTKSRSTKPKRPRPSSPDPRRTQTHSHPHPTTASFASLPHHQQPIHGLPLHRNQTPMGMGGGTFESSQGTPLRGLGLGMEGGAGGGMGERK
ncbi:hypothetical protein BDY24DRAFT_391070 [Mrakia frigida]|uniref:uncharacterized protein n=1 Tax=Mrakia frigida TaxID=29902 RepID=UPI003FCC0EFD